jgi:hypothetical protein
MAGLFMALNMVVSITPNPGSTFRCFSATAQCTFVAKLGAGGFGETWCVRMFWIQTQHAAACVRWIHVTRPSRARAHPLTVAACACRVPVSTPQVGGRALWK